MIKASCKYDLPSESYLRSMGKIIPSVMIDSMKEAMLAGEATSKKTFGRPGKLKSRTGHLRRNIKMDVIKNGSVYTGYLFNKVKYAAIHEEGGIIRAKPGKWLMFKIGSKFIKTKKVTIPARPFMRPGIIRAKRRLSHVILPSLIRKGFQG